VDDDAATEAPADGGAPHRRRRARTGPPRQPRAHWALLGLVLFVLAAGLTLDGYRLRAIGHSGTDAQLTGGPATLAGAGPVLDLSGSSARSVTGAPRTIALTFDDGPDPRWTPQVLAVLARRHVPATFFVVGSRVLAYPQLVRAELAAGDEVGSHTFVHAYLTNLPGFQRDLELSLTQSALAAAAGIHTSLLRPPYSSEPDAATTADVRTWRAVARQGYLIVLANRDAQDWRKPGVNAILANAAPDASAGTVVMFHDGGGDRSQTVAAVDRFITSLQSQGYRFTTVTGLAGLPATAADTAVPFSGRLQGRLVAFTARLGQWTVLAVRWTALPIGLLLIARCLVLLVFARRHRRDQRRNAHDPTFHPPVTVIVPAYNEEVGVATAVRSIAGSAYPTVEVIVVDDGSTDATADVVEGLALPNVRLVRQHNGGKATALNTGIGLASHGVIITVDGDTAFEPDTIATLVQPLRAPTVGAVSGNTKVGNRGGLLGRWQHIEYVMGFNLDRRMYDLLGCMPTVPGAIGAFRREVLLAVGGFKTDTLAEDTDVTMAIGRLGWRVAYAHGARAWTEAPATWSALWKQRYRWSYGNMQALWKHRGSLRDGSRLGRYGFPYVLLFQVLLPLLSPVIDLYALFGLFAFNLEAVLAYWAAINALNLVVAGYALRTDGESLRPLWTVPLQQFVYRQLVYLVVIQAAVTAALGSRLRWQKLERSGEFAGGLGYAGSEAS
jgi:cellulose synthase/poly-beta-1,6-N-acetylglucosamine synthase-like glycosyltransferase/peptidoglycan/xylan/chitin deacetylase (PgdA/CDA1 family)